MGDLNPAKTLEQRPLVKFANQSMENLRDQEEHHRLEGVTLA